MTVDEYHALLRLAAVPRGIGKNVMLARGFTHDLITGLAQAGLVTVVHDIATIGEQSIGVELVMITDAGRQALEGVTAPRSSPRPPQAR